MDPRDPSPGLAPWRLNRSLALIGALMLLLPGSAGAGDGDGSNSDFGLIVFIFIVLVLAPVLYLIYLRSVARKNAALLRLAAEASGGTCTEAGPGQKPGVEFEIGGLASLDFSGERRPARLAFVRHGTTTYTQLIIELDPGEGRPFVLAPKSIKNEKPEYDMSFFAFDLMFGGLERDTLWKFVDEARQTELVRLFDGGFEYRFQAASPEARFTKALFDDQLREAIMDFCYDLDEFWLYVHGGEQVVLSRIEAMEKTEDFRRFIELGRLLLSKHLAAAVVVPRADMEAGERPICPACEERVLTEPRACPHCGAAYHADCWHLQNECAACAKTMAV